MLQADRATHVVGIDVGMESCTMCCLARNKQPLIPATPFANTLTGFNTLFERLDGLGVPPELVLIGLEATSRYGENLFQALLKRGYQVWRLASRADPCLCPTTGHARQNGSTRCPHHCAGVARAGEARFGYVPSEQVAAYRELLRVHHQLSDDLVRYKNEIHAVLVVQFPEFTQVFADPTRPTALAVLKRYPSAQAIAQTPVEALSAFLHEIAPHHYGLPTAQTLIRLATASINSGLAVSARASSLRILCDQLEHTQHNLEELEREIDQFLEQDPKAKGMLSVPEFGSLTIAVLRAELGDLTRFTRIDQVVAYVGLDLLVKQSGKWRGQTKLSKRGSGRVRRILYLAALRSIARQASPFGTYYHRLVARGMKKGMAVVAVMRKMLIVAVHLILTEESYDPGRVAVQAGS